jgi:4-alpha-glucanotransferase
MNIPGTASNNWKYQLGKDDLETLGKILHSEFNI